MKNLLFIHQFFEEYESDSWLRYSLVSAPFLLLLTIAYNENVAHTGDLYCYLIRYSRSHQNGRYRAFEIFKRIFLNENNCIVCDTIDSKPALY